MGRIEIKGKGPKLEQLAGGSDLSCPANFDKSFCFIDGNNCRETTKEKCVKYLTENSRRIAYKNAQYQENLDGR